MYTQGDERWGDLLLGTSNCTCAQYGCLATNVAEALTLSGWNITPADLIIKGNPKGLFNKDGLLVWAVLTELFPQFHLDQGSQYTFQEGAMGAFTHWVLKNSGVIYDPLFGDNREPAGFHETSYHRTATIDQSPSYIVTTVAGVVPTTYAPFVTDLFPNQVYNAEVFRIQQFLQWQECLGSIPASSHGFYGPLTELAIKLFKSKNGISITDLWDNDARGIANGILLNQHNQEA